MPHPSPDQQTSDHGLVPQPSGGFPTSASTLSPTDGHHPQVPVTSDGALSSPSPLLSAGLGPAPAPGSSSLPGMALPWALASVSSLPQLPPAQGLPPKGSWAHGEGCEGGAESPSPSGGPGAVGGGAGAPVTSRSED